MLQDYKVNRRNKSYACYYENKPQPVFTYIVQLSGRCVPSAHIRRVCLLWYRSTLAEKWVEDP